MLPRRYQKFMMDLENPADEILMLEVEIAAFKEQVGAISMERDELRRERDTSLRKLHSIRDMMTQILNETKAQRVLAARRAGGNSAAAASRMLEDGQLAQFAVQIGQLSDAEDEHIERELARRGVMERVNNVHDEHNPEPVDTRIQRSWWRGLYDRVSQSNPDDDNALAHPSISKPKCHAKSKSKSRRASRDEERKGLMYTYDDLPPPSALQTYRSSRRASQEMAARPPPPSDGMPTLFASIPEHDVHHAPHPSPLSPTRSDSLLGRVFPPSQPRTSEHGHATVTSASSHAYPDPAKSPGKFESVPVGTDGESTRQFGVARRGMRSSVFGIRRRGAQAGRGAAAGR
ncbi:hypothetical protein OF83DRAFT_1183196 [Amylostereum chailletii]|nr:hypothetical protein OF83DRAFT_1183196 [Amylostereum chailletii]